MKLGKVVNELSFWWSWKMIKNLSGSTTRALNNIRLCAPVPLLCSMFSYPVIYLIQVATKRIGLSNKSTGNYQWLIALNQGCPKSLTRGPNFIW